MSERLNEEDVGDIVSHYMYRYILVLLTKYLFFLGRLTGRLITRLIEFSASC